MTTRSGLSARLQGLAATLAILAIVIAMPLALLALGANPIPQHLPDLATIGRDLFSRDDGTLALGVFQAGAWVAWAVLTTLIGLELVATARRVNAPTIPALGKPQSAARSLVAAAALLFITTTPMLPTPAPATAASITAPSDAATAGTPRQHPPAAPVSTDSTDSESRPTTATFSYAVHEGDNLWDLAQTYLGDGHRYHELAELNRDIVGHNPGFLEQGWVLQIPDTDAGHRARTYVVQPDDTLEAIAAGHLGDPSRWPEIFHASAGITQPDGRHITNPDLIRPGYTVRIPQQKTGDQAVTPPATTPAVRHQHKAATTPQGTAPHDSVSSAPAHPATPAEPTPPAHPADHTNDASQQPQTSESDSSGDSSSDRTAGEETSILSAPWVVPGLAAGAVLCAALLISLRTRRRAQFRARRPGRAIALPPPELVPYEKTMVVAGYPLERSVEFLNAVLRRLALHIAAAQQAAPPVAAVELTEASATLHLTHPADLPDPWVGSPDKLRWTATTGSDVAVSEHGAPAPFPLLVTIGRDDDGHWWLLNLEHLGTITIGGDTERARDLLRSLACELALAPWADSARVDGIGIGSEAARMDSRRARFHATDTAAADTAAGSVLAFALDMIDRADRVDSDTPTGRSTQVDDELWPARLLLVGAAGADAGADAASLQRLIDLIAGHPDRTGASVVLADRDLSGAFAIDLAADGRLRVAQAGLDLIPVGLTEDAADGAARVLEHGEDVADVEVPADQTATDGWQAFTDTTGAIRREYTVPRNVEQISPEPARSLLEDDDGAYVEAAAVTEEDLEQVAPRIPVKVCEAVEAADPTLQEDFEAWVSQDPTRPRLRLLGPVKVTAYGKQAEVADRVGFYTELVAYLASKSRYGATTDEVVEAFGYQDRNRVRVDMTVVRSWLGHNTRTGKPFLPNATDAPAKREHGKNVYQLDTGDGGVLVDTDLFLRKKKRAQARGEAGMDDLRQALTLVEGIPYSRTRDGGWSWLLEGDRVDEHLKVAVSDAAHILTTHYLTHGDVHDAFAVAKIGVLAASDEDTMQLNLARVMTALGQTDEAEKLLNDEVFNRSDDGLAPKDLSERTKKIISSWKATG